MYKFCNYDQVKIIRVKTYTERLESANKNQFSMKFVVCVLSINHKQTTEVSYAI